MTMPSKVLCKICGRDFEPEDTPSGGASLQEHILCCIAQDFDVINASITATSDSRLNAVCIEIKRNCFIDIYQSANGGWFIDDNEVITGPLTWGATANIYEALASALLTL